MAALSWLSDIKPRRSNMKPTTLIVAALAIGMPPALVIAQDNAASQGYMAAHGKMMAEMQKMKPSGDTDKDFVMMMIPHHQGAIDMAKVELEYGTDEKLKAMAQKMIEDQQKEIEEMKAWQQANM
jgi:uncharacterized protein (DUF305 family)